MAHRTSTRKRPKAASRARERALVAAGYPLVAGVDEAGCGALAGPVVVGAAIFEPDVTIPHLTDSKLLIHEDRLEIFELIKAQSVAWATAVYSSEAIDRINIYQARLRGMYDALQLLSPAPDYALIDGHVTPQLPIPAEPVIGGDRACRVIAAGSILAKVTRDLLMIRLDEEYPGYGFAEHKGYGTPPHLEALHRLGPCPAHRHTFAPVARCAQQTLDF